MRIYDVAMTHLLDADDFFIHRVQQHCAEARLNFFLIEPLWAEAWLQNLVMGKIGARVLLNMHSEHNQPAEVFHRLVRLAAQKNTRVIDPPDVALAAFDKAQLHPRLMHAGIHVPHSVMVPFEQAMSFQLSEAERAMIGSPFVIKPSMGYGRPGLVLNAPTEKDLALSAAAWKNSHYLLQRKIVPRQLEADPGYFRIYFVFGHVWICWWNCFTDRYRQVTAEEIARFSLGRLEQIIRTIAGLTRMNFFSSEIAVTDANEFIVIDYVRSEERRVGQECRSRRSPYH